jgi:lipopolysaccharide transport system permease protein
MASTSSQTVESGKQRRVIRATRGWASLHLAELWEYRELMYFLTWRDVKVRYKQAVLGIAWAVLQPVVTMVVFTVVFNKIMNVQYTPYIVNGKEVPYAIFTYAALLPWQLFSGALQRSGSSLVGNANLLTKIYFPRLIMPISGVIAGLVDFGISFVVFLVLMAGYGITPTWHVVWLPLLVLLAMVTALAFGLWLSALNVLYRDVQYVIPFLVQVWMFASPVIYSPEFDNPLYTFLYALNPMAGVINGFRWALIGGPAPSGTILISTGMVLILLVSGLLYFKRMERTFADVI